MKTLTDAIKAFFNFEQGEFESVKFGQGKFYSYGILIAELIDNKMIFNYEREGFYKVQRMKHQSAVLNYNFKNDNLEVIDKVTLK